MKERILERKVYDCFTFFNELDILELRLNEMNDVVDYFVLVESTKTFTGLEKPLYFQNNLERYKAFRDKIIHIVVDDLPDTNSPWTREHLQRDAIRRGLTGARDEDLIIIADVDEILRPSCLLSVRDCDGFLQFYMDMYQFYMNLRSHKDAWTASYGFTWFYRDLIPDFSRARLAKSKAEVERVFQNNFHHIHNAGWHFTHLGGVQFLQEKFLSYSHSKDPWPQTMMREGALAKQILTGLRVGQIRNLSEFVPLDDTFPQKVIAQEAYYRRIGFIKDVYEAISEVQQELQAIKMAYALKTFESDQQQSALGSMSSKEYLKLYGATNPIFGKLSNLPDPIGSLVSLGKKAIQSSISSWSRGHTVEEDASNVLDGEISGDAKCHTDIEDNAWWMVDLGALYNITEIRIFNRIFPKPAVVRARASHFKIEIGSDLNSFVEVFSKEDESTFGGADGHPFFWIAPVAYRGRYTRITLLKRSYLHFSQVQVFGHLL